jgi:hypothetical protein
MFLKRLWTIKWSIREGFMNIHLMSRAESECINLFSIVLIGKKWRVVSIMELNNGKLVEKLFTWRNFRFFLKRIGRNLVELDDIKDGVLEWMDGWILGGGDRAPARGPRFELIVLPGRKIRKR